MSEQIKMNVVEGVVNQSNSRAVLNENNGKLNYIERFEELKRIVLEELSLIEGIVTNSSQIVRGEIWIDSIKNLISEIREVVISKITEPADNSLLSLIDNTIIEAADLLDEYLQEHLEVREKLNIEYFDSSVLSKKEQDKLLEKLTEFEYKLQSVKSNLTSFSILKDNYDKVVHGFIQRATIQTDAELSSFRKLRNIADNAMTEKIYDKAVDRYRKLEVDYRNLFYLSIGITLIFSILVFSLKGQLVPNFFSNIEFWAIKISLLAVGITLITYFLKQSTHYQRLADQNYQTQIELQAYPSFMESIPTDEAASVRKELALKYFGREIDGSVHKDMGNLVVDQMKSTTEMVKATTDAIKKLKEF